jgi:hypothetical protein
MNLPINFPKDEDVIREEAARFRALSPEEQVNELDRMVSEYYRLASLTMTDEEIRRHVEKEEEEERKAIMEFVARHGGPIPC